MSTECEYHFDHEPGETCEHCKLEVDDYGNTEADFINCSFPNCGCDGQRLCMAPEGPSENAVKCNVENMYNRNDKEAQRGKLGLCGLVLDMDRSNQDE